MNTHDLLQNLSNRERAVFELIAVGIKPVRIAEQLGLSIKTVSTYRSRCLDKLGVKSNAELARIHMGMQLEVLSDHSLVAQAMCAGCARWVPCDRGTGELVVDGVRYWTVLEDGVPKLTETLRSALRAAIGKAIEETEAAAEEPAQPVAQAAQL